MVYLKINISNYKYKKYEKCLGEYNPYARERKKNKEGENCIIFYPNGYKIKIEIHFYQYNFTIQIGDEDFNRYDYSFDD